MATLYFDVKKNELKFVDSIVPHIPGLNIVLASGPVVVERNMAGCYYAFHIGDMKEALVVIPIITGKRIDFSVRTHGLAKLGPEIYTMQMAKTLKRLAKSKYMMKGIWNCAGLDFNVNEPFTALTTIRILPPPTPTEQPLRLCEAQLPRNRSLVFYAPAERSMASLSRFKLHRTTNNVEVVTPTQR
jgi:hypothetical protein